MINNPKDCWMYCLQTDSLREPGESWELLQYMIHNPHLSIKEAAEDKGVDYDKARTWSSRYYYKSRIRAYTRDMNNKLHHAITNLKLQQIADETKKNKIEQGILNNELYFVQKEQLQMVELEKEGTPIPDYLKENVEVKEKNYFMNKLNKRRSDRIIWDIVSEPVDLSEVTSELTTETPEIKSFLKAMEQNRDAEHKN